MDEKFCGKCGREKPLNSFGRDKNSPDGRRYECLECRSTHSRRLYESSRDKYRARSAKWKDDHREDVRASGRKYYEDNKERYLEYKRVNVGRIREWNKICRERFKKKYPNYGKEYWTAKRETLLTKKKEYYKANREAVLAKSKEWQKNNREKRSESQRIWQSKKIKNDIGFRLLHCLRSRINVAIRGNIKSARTQILTGCSIDFLRRYLESKFVNGMTWNNYGEWHIDHIRPCCLFDMSVPEEQKRCFHYTNLQPLWAKENLRKGGRLEAA